jgi:hypothetical protein
MPGELVTHTNTLLPKEILQTVEMTQLTVIPSMLMMDTTLFWKQLLIWKPQELLPLPVQKLAMSGEKVTHTITLKEKEELQIVEMIQPTDIPFMLMMDIMPFWPDPPIWKLQELLPLLIKQISMPGELVTHTDMVLLTQKNEYGRTMSYQVQYYNLFKFV